MSGRPGEAISGESEAGPEAKKQELPSDRITDANRDYRFGDGDITVISSDELYFKVHSYRLMSASAVFRTMLALGVSDENRTVTLTDEALEHSDVLSLFFDTVYARSLVPPGGDTDGERYITLARLIKKYDAEVSLEILRTSCRLWALQEARWASIIFTIGCELGDMETLQASIKRGGRVLAVEASLILDFFSNLLDHLSCTAHIVEDSLRIAQTENAEKHLHDQYIEGAEDMDITSWTFELFKTIPDAHKYALMRAARAPQTATPKRNWNAVAQKWVQYMEELKKTGIKF